MYLDQLGDPHQIVKCTCESDEHQMSFWYLTTYECCDGTIQYPEELYFSTHLSPIHGFWWKVWNGIKYMFGYRCKWGDFDNVCLNLAKAEEIKEIIDRFIKEMKTCQIQLKPTVE